MTAAATAPATIAERIKQLLGQGLTGSVVASAVGCDPSYISQLLEDEQFHQEVLHLRAGKAEGAVKRDNDWDEIENKALSRAATLIDYVSRPNDLIRIAAMANAAKRRSTEFASGGESAAPTVNLVLPQNAIIHFQMNANSQVVEVDGRSMQALPTKRLMEMTAEKQAAREQLGTVEVRTPRIPSPASAHTERKKVETILDQIGYADEPVPVQKVV